MSHAVYVRGTQFLKYFGTAPVLVTVLADAAASSAVPEGNETVIAPVRLPFRSFEFGSAAC
jgi:hypothetical protein